METVSHPAVHACLEVWRNILRYQRLHQFGRLTPVRNLEVV
jgi:hypothetical protein